MLAILRDYAERTPGSLVEEKPMGLAWHFRAADPEYGAVQANELQLHLKEMLSNTPVEIVPGEKVIEIRAHGINKGRIVPAILTRLPGALLVAIGDDRTDEDLFAALPPEAVAVHVGTAQQPGGPAADGRAPGAGAAAAVAVVGPDFPHPYPLPAAGERANNQLDSRRSRVPACLPSPWPQGEGKGGESAAHVWAPTALVAPPALQ